MTPASVGFHCPECLKSNRQTVVSGSAVLRGIDPIITKVLVGINVLVFAVDYLIRGSSTTLAPEAGWDCLPSGGLREAGILLGCSVDQGEWWRLISSGFLHADLMHIAFNMVLLWRLGTSLEQSLGRARYLVLYFGSLLAGSLGVMLISPDQRTLGASGAVFGLMGAYAMASRAANRSMFEGGVGGLIIINVIFTFAVPNISIGGHLGGLIGGGLIGFAYFELRKRMGKASAPIALGIGTALLVAFFIAAVLASSTWTAPIF